MTAEQWGGLDHFTSNEFTYPDKMDFGMIFRLDQARAAAGVPFFITSDWRPEGDGKSHHQGKAVDIRCGDARTLARINFGLVDAGFRRIGWYYKEITGGNHHILGHVHADLNTADEGFDQDVSWIGVSRR